MKISTRARYALRMLLDLWRSADGDRPVRLEEVAERTGISRRYLDQLVLPLKAAGLLRGVKGPGGGYVLGRPATEIRLGEIVEAEIGPIALVDCVSDPESCERQDGCASHLVYRLVSARVRRSLDKYSLADLARPELIERLREEVERLEG